MDAAMIRAALTGLEQQLEKARVAKNQKVGEDSDGTGTYADPEAAFVWFLGGIYESLMLVLEAAGLTEARSRLAAKWEELKKQEGGIGAVFDAMDYWESPTLDYLNRLVESLRVSAGEGLSTIDSYELAKLETVLQNTPAILRRAGVTPRRELDIQREMHKYLQAFFTEYKKDVTIAGIIRDFKPDCGVRNLRTAIEFKYADREQKVARAIAGVFEDTSGYKGSPEWTNFYAVVYQTQAFESQDRVKSEISRAGVALTWKAFLVTGAGARSPSRRREPKACR